MTAEKQRNFLMAQTWEETKMAHLDMAKADDQMNTAQEGGKLRSAPTVLLAAAAQTSTVLPDTAGARDDVKDTVGENTTARRHILLAMVAPRLLVLKNSTLVVEPAMTMMAASDMATMIVATVSMTLTISRKDNLGTRNTM
jgi:hypothetical protein